MKKTINGLALGWLITNIEYHPKLLVLTLRNFVKDNADGNREI